MFCNNLGNVTDESVGVVNGNPISLYVAPSNINLSDFGLFTNYRIPEGTRICSYLPPNRMKEYSPFHRILTQQEKDYTVHNEDDTVRIVGIDSLGNKTCCASWINDPLDSMKWNVRFKWDGRLNQDCEVYAESSISPKEELYIPYDGPYWYDGSKLPYLIERAFNCYGMRSNIQNFQRGITISEQRQGIPSESITIFTMRRQWAETKSDPQAARRNYIERMQPDRVIPLPMEHNDNSESISFYYHKTSDGEDNRYNNIGMYHMISAMPESRRRTFTLPTYNDTPIPEDLNNINNNNMNEDTRIADDEEVINTNPVIIREIIDLTQGITSYNGNPENVIVLNRDTPEQMYYLRQLIEVQPATLVINTINMFEDGRTRYPTTPVEDIPNVENPIENTLGYINPFQLQRNNINAMEEDINISESDDSEYEDGDQLNSDSSRHSEDDTVEEIYDHNNITNSDTENEGEEGG